MLTCTHDLYTRSKYCFQIRFYKISGWFKGRTVLHCILRTDLAGITVRLTILTSVTWKSWTELPLSLIKRIVWPCTQNTSCFISISIWYFDMKSNPIRMASSIGATYKLSLNCSPFISIVQSNILP